MTLVDASTGEVVPSGPVLTGRLTDTGYVIPDGLSFDEWAAEGTVLLTMARSCMWWVGDWIRYGERNYGEKYTQAIEATGASYQTLKNAVWVCERIPPPERRVDVAFSHHRAVAALDRSPRGDLLAKAAEEGWTERDLLAEVRKLKHRDRVIEARGHEVPEHAGTVVDNLDEAPSMYKAIVVDPPWRYDNRATRNAAEKVYLEEDGRDETTMSQAELLDLRLPAANDSHLYLWVTNSFIKDGFELMETWGFTYKTCLTWCKPQFGMGNYFRSSTEHVLFGIRGKAPTLQNNVPTHFVADRRHHSAKPESFYDLVESCSPGPWLEMFARRRRMRWDVWGNEA